MGSMTSKGIVFDSVIDHAESAPRILDFKSSWDARLLGSQSSFKILKTFECTDCLTHISLE